MIGNTVYATLRSYFMPSVTSRGRCHKVNRLQRDRVLKPSDTILILLTMSPMAPDTLTTEETIRLESLTAAFSDDALTPMDQFHPIPLSHSAEINLVSWHWNQATSSY